MFTVYLVNIVKEFFLSVFKTSEERLKNPFIGTFILSFLAFNWKPILVLIFSSIPIEDRVSYVSNNYSHIGFLLVLPLLISLLYVIVLPYLMCWIEDVTFKSHEDRSKNLYDIKDLDLIGKIRIAEKEIILEDKRADYKGKADLNNQIRQLKSVIEILEGEKEGLSNRLNESLSSINSLKDEKKYLVKERKEAFDKLVEIEHEKITFDEDYYKAPKDSIDYFKYNFNDIISTNKSSIRNKNEYKSENNMLELLGLIKSNNYFHKDDGTIREKYDITDKGWYFIKKSYENGY